jgi:sugar phosphate isomerase/epimerase
MMKLGCASWGFRKMNVDEYMEAVSQLGLGNMEIECFNADEASNNIPEECDVSGIKDFENKAIEKGLNIVSFAGGNDFTAEDKTVIEEDVKQVKKMIDLAAAGNIEVIRLFAGWLEEKKVADSTFQQVIDCFKETGQYAQKKNVILAIENHGGITRTPEQVKRILDGVDMPSVGLNCDPANFHHFGVDPVEALRKLEDYIVYFHLKDSEFKNGEHDFKAVGDGDINWGPIFEWLNTSYTGYAMIEYEDPEDIVEGTQKSIAYLKRHGIQ